eukprot:CAMPEP_0119132368 /NCGR_PEP_ID=MMETSP1310-20130426/11802_1 /TAXON_ID=464262 /ORGANISM="Genus nov. species nov., Strain RCC2339" /LENGTH=277 /DNA_ID=CAMNT_0007122999 /DNA_START=50 /DNA_END=883 /DNA_ORIENTATION=-
MWELGTVFPIPYWLSIVICTFLAGAYVGSIYLWNVVYRSEKERRRLGNRDDPWTIRRRFASVGLACAVGLGVMFLAAGPQVSMGDVLWAMGIRTDATVLLAATLPLASVMLLFAGPLLHLVLDGDLQLPDFDVYCARNLLVCPLTEEFVFRACVVPLFLAGGASRTTAVYASPLFFGLAHLHHVLAGKPVVMCLFQLLYTTVFGWISTYLFIRTGHLIAPFVAHAFCNYMGFPDFAGGYRHDKRLLILPAYVLGLAGFFLLTPYLTLPGLYDNDVYS